jgi:hypothetical protein
MATLAASLKIIENRSRFAGIKRSFLESQRAVTVLHADVGHLC